jgi:hypothetical protein
MTDTELLHEARLLAEQINMARHEMYNKLELGYGPTAEQTVRLCEILDILTGGQ